MAEENNVWALPGCELPPDQVLNLAKGKLRGVVVIGWLEEPDEDGHLFHLASSYGDAESVIYAIQHANLWMLEWSR